MRKGEKVKIIIEQLESIDWDGFLSEHNDGEKDYKSYIIENSEKIYKVRESFGEVDIYLEDEFLGDVRFYKNELKKV